MGLGLVGLGFLQTTQLYELSLLDAAHPMRNVVGLSRTTKTCKSRELLQESLTHLRILAGRGH